MELKFRNNDNMAIIVIFTVYAWLTILNHVVSQVIWTPIYIDGSSQVDLWTKASRGCPCPWDEDGTITGKKDCACCVQTGGCHCGQEAPNRCAQCGLEHYCSSMCNLTIDSNTLIAKSGKTFGQIKSPSIEGPSSCWYTLRPGVNQRVELQIYRLVNVGKFNGTSCTGGYLEWQANDSEVNINQPIQICGANERYSPPVVMYSDTNNTATLFFQINEKTLRSQFLAYFSFTPKNSTQGVGFRAKGGSRVPNTACDWTYQDLACTGKKECVLASPGYPGMYPPNTQCKYHISTSSIHTRVKISFTAVLLPHNHCLTDYIAVYQGSTTSDLLLNTICGNRHPTLEFTGPNLLVVFSSGPQVPPYNYNGFVATLEFIEKTLSTESTLSTGIQSFSSTDDILLENSVLGTVSTGISPPKSNCNIFISGNNSRSGHFDTKTKEYHPYCRVVFRGAPTDVIHMSLFNYRLKTPACRSVIEIFDGLVEEGARLLKKICSPATKVTRDSHGNFIEQQTFISKRNVLSLVLRRSAPPNASDDIEFVDGAYLFHDEQIGGTLQPDKMCDVHYYGMSSPSVGTIDNPIDQHLFWSINGQLKCVQQFIPAANQSITITVRTLDQMKSYNGTCQTQCGDNGCQCVSDTTPLEQVDYLLLMAEDGQSLTCLCGNFQAEWLPVIVRSWSPVHVIYSVAQYTWNNKGYSFSAVYAFVNDGECGHNTINHLNGEVTSKNLSTTGHFNNFYHLSCTWILDSTVQRQLLVDILSSQSRPCTAWNISIHEYSAKADNDLYIGEHLHTFCPRDKHKTYSLPWKSSTAVIRLRALTRKQPQFIIRWRSQMIRSNTRLVNPTPAPNAVSNAPAHYVTVLIIYLYVINVISVLDQNQKYYS